MLSFDKVSCGGRIDFLNIFAVQGIIFLSVVFRDDTAVNISIQIRDACIERG